MTELIKILEKIEPKITNAARFFSRNKEDVNDLVSVGISKICEVYSDIGHNKIDRIDKYFTNVARYAIYRYAKDEHKKHAEKFVSVEIIEDYLHPVDNRCPSSNIIEKEENEQLLNRLSDLHKNIAYDKYINNFSYKMLMSKYGLKKHEIYDIIKEIVRQTKDI